MSEDEHHEPGQAESQLALVETLGELPQEDKRFSCLDSSQRVTAMGMVADHLLQKINSGALSKLDSDEFYNAACSVLCDEAGLDLTHTPQMHNTLFKKEFMSFVGKSEYSKVRALFGGGARTTGRAAAPVPILSTEDLRKMYLDVVRLDEMAENMAVEHEKNQKERKAAAAKFKKEEDEALAAALTAHKDAKDRYDILAKAAAKAEMGSGKKRGGGGGEEEEEEEGGGGGAASSAKKPAVGGGSKPITRLTVELKKFSEKQRNKLLELGIIKPDGENWTTTGTVPLLVRRNKLGGDKSIPHLNNYFDSEDFTKIISLGLVQRPEPLPPAAALTEGGDEVRRAAIGLNLKSRSPEYRSPQ